MDDRVEHPLVPPGCIADHPLLRELDREVAERGHVIGLPHELDARVRIFDGAELQHLDERAERRPLVEDLACSRLHAWELTDMEEVGRLRDGRRDRERITRASKTSIPRRACSRYAFAALQNDVVLAVTRQHQEERGLGVGTGLLPIGERIGDQTERSNLGVLDEPRVGDAPPALARRDARDHRRRTRRDEAPHGIDVLVVTFVSEPAYPVAREKARQGCKSVPLHPRERARVEVTVLLVPGPEAFVIGDAEILPGAQPRLAVLVVGVDRLARGGLFLPRRELVRRHVANMGGGERRRRADERDPLEIQAGRSEPIDDDGLLFALLRSPRRIAQHGRKIVRLRRRPFRCHLPFGEDTRRGGLELSLPLACVCSAAPCSGRSRKNAKTTGASTGWLAYVASTAAASFRSDARERLGHVARRRLRERAVLRLHEQLRQVLHEDRHGLGRRKRAREVERIYREVEGPLGLCPSPDERTLRYRGEKEVVRLRLRPCASAASRSAFAQSSSGNVYASHERSLRSPSLRRRSARSSAPRHTRPPALRRRDGGAEGTAHGEAGSSPSPEGRPTSSCSRRRASRS